MSNRISGKEAWNLMADMSEDVEYTYTSSTMIIPWAKLTQKEFMNWETIRFFSGNYIFRKKPKTIMIDGKEYQGSIEPKHGETYYVIDASNPLGYSECLAGIDTANEVFGKWTLATIVPLVNHIKSLGEIK